MSGLRAAHLNQQVVIFEAGKRMRQVYFTNQQVVVTGGYDGRDRDEVLCGIL